VLQFAPSTYYAAISHVPSSRELSDAVLCVEVLRVWEESFKVYGAEKVWHQLQREGFDVGRDRVARLMKKLGIQGVRRGKPRRTTAPGEAEERPEDLVRRDFSAAAPNLLWVADITYVALRRGGFAYVAFVIDAFSRVIVGWAVSASLSAELALDALEMAIWSRKDDEGALGGLVHHSDRGSQYTSVRYSQRLEGSGVAPSVGSKGDSFDNALAEAVNGLYKAELVWHQGPWETVTQLEAATAAWVSWWNTTRIHSACNWATPAEVEAAFWAAQQGGAGAGPEN
jgi:putative transposase